MSQSSPRENLKRSITLLHLVGIEIGQSIGAGIFALTGIALVRTEPSLFLDFLAAAVPVGFAMAVLATIGSDMPISGGTYYYGSRYFSPVAAFTGVWAYLSTAKERAAKARIVLKKVATVAVSTRIRFLPFSLNRS